MPGIRFLFWNVNRQPLGLLKGSQAGTLALRGAGGVIAVFGALFWMGGVTP